MPETKRKCPRCKGTHLWKVGFVPLVTGHKTRYKCVKCGHTFYDKDKKKKRGS
jgi:transposase-like protein